MDTRENDEPKAFEEIRVTRLLVGAPGEETPRAVLEVAGGREDRGVRLSLADDRGFTSLSLEVGPEGMPRILIGDADRGLCVEIEGDGILLWMGGNAVAALRARAEGGAIDLCDRRGERILTLPGGSGD